MDGLRVIQENMHETHDGKVYLSAAVLTADRANRNNCLYPRKVVEGLVEQFKAQGHPMVGQIGMPTDTFVPAAHVSHQVVSLEMDGDNLMAGIEVLNTPMGRALKNLIQGGMRPAFRTCGVGTVRQEGGVSVVDTFHLSTVSAVPPEDAA
jgi:hypothetical protein